MTPYADPEAASAYAKEYRQKHKEELYQKGVKWRAENKEAMAAKKKVYAESNRDAIREKKRKYYKSHKHFWDTGRWRNRDRINQRKLDVYHATKVLHPKKLLTPEERKANDKAYRERNKAKIAERSRLWNARQPKHPRIKKTEEQLKATARAWKNANYLRLSELNKKWRWANPDRVRLHKHNDYIRRKAEYQAKSKIWKRKVKESTVDLESVQEFYRFVRTKVTIKCYYCGVPVSGSDAHIDHIIPVSKGGPHCVSNLCASCPKCNLSKNDKLPSEFKSYLNL